MEEAREKKYLEIPLSKIMKFRPYRKLLFCIYILFSHDEITLEEIQQKLNSPETFEDFKRLVDQYQLFDGKRDTDYI